MPNTYNWNGKQFQNLNPRYYKKNKATHYGIAMTTVTTTDRIMISKGVKNRTVHFDFRWQRIIRYGPRARAGTTQESSIESVSLRRIVDVARGPLRRGARLEAISPIG